MLANVVESYEKLISKYKNMVDVRKENYAVDINEFLPSMSEMLKEDCVWDVLEEMQKEVGGGTNKEKAAYYFEDPPLMSPGYHEAENCFVLKYNKDLLPYSDKEKQFGEFDGSHWYFDIKGLSTNGSFTVNDKEYKTFEDYLRANKVSYLIDEDTKDGNDGKITVVSAGISASPIPRFATQVVKDKSKIKKLEAKSAKLKGCIMMPYKINTNGSTDPLKWTYSNYEDDEKLEFYESSNGTLNQIFSGINAKEALKSQGQSVKNDVSYYTIVAESNNAWGSETVLDGYKAQAKVADLFKNKKVKDVIIILDRNVHIGSRANSNASYFYSSALFTLQNIGALIADYKKVDTGIKLGQLTFGGYGCDKSGTMIGNVWVRMETEYGDGWIDLSKYVASGTQFTDTNPSFSNSPELSKIYDGLSDTFKSWNNAGTNFVYADSLSANAVKSYEDRIALHKELTGIDFKTARDYTVLLGDTLFIIPPEAIHTSSTLDYEKLPILRGKGSMMKNRMNIEELIELELYFNNEYGINGIPYTTKTPNGEEITYYMNGLRSLIAQFKVSPFLPIENHYINDILNIEVVSLVNINVMTVDGFPKLLKVVLTLRDFNYRVFMPDLPFPEVNGNGELSSMEHVFAKCFNWELYRYYYQKGIISGEGIKAYEYNTYEHNDFFYSHKNVYTRADLTDSNFEFYVPDINWLKAAFQVKKAKDQNGTVEYDLEGDKKEGYKLYEGSNEEITTVKNNNKPMITDKDKNLSVWSPSMGGMNPNLSNLDKQKRVGRAVAMLDYSMMPKSNEEREDISSINPTGFINKKYNNVASGGYIYNRSHLVGWQLCGLNAVRQNLFTGTRALNSAMLNYENQVAEYLRNNQKNHVFYRVTPIYDGGNLLASGIQMEAYSIEDDGKGIQFNVYIANVQSGIYINYATGDNKASGSNSDDEDAETYNYYHYTNPRNMKFVPYLMDESGNSMKIELDEISFNMANYFTETHLKATDGFAPQYMGGSDVTIEMKMTITDEGVITALNTLPHYIMDNIRNYRRVMPCFPLKIKNEYLQMIGVNEVVFDNISISTKPGFPGVYDVQIRLTSMDRTMRQREALQKVNSNAQTSALAAENIGNYFSLQDTLAAAEVYPDLDLPTIQELKDAGWRFAKWSNEKRIFVDPDFYLCYSFQYASKLIKEIVNNILYKVSYNAAINEQKEKSGGEKTTNKYAKDANIINQMCLIDNTAMGADISPGTDFNGVNIDNKVGFSDLYDDIVNGIQEGADKDSISKASTKKEQRKERLYSTTAILQYLTASGIENGWEVRPGWRAPLCDQYINDEMMKFKYSGVEVEKTPSEDENQFITDIYDLRHRIIMLINRILDKPLQTDKDKNIRSYTDYLKIEDAVNAVFDNDDGKQLLALLCPMGEIYISPDNRGAVFNPKLVDYPQPMEWLKFYLYALACARSGSQPYGTNKKDAAWQPNQWQDRTYSEADKAAMDAGLRGEKIPYNKVELKNNATDNPLAETYDSWHEDGVSFGAGQITRYSKSMIKTMLEPKSKIKYFNYGYKGGASEYYNHMYYKTAKAKRNRFCETGFIDQYYNYAGYNSKEGKDYIERISNFKTANFEALLREVLMYVKYLVMEGLLISELDVIANDWENFKAVLKDATKWRFEDIGDVQVEDIRDNAFVKTFENFNPIFKAAGAIAEGAQDLGQNIWDWITGKDEEDELEEEEEDTKKEIADQFEEEIPKSYAKLFCARLIYPFLLAATNNNSEILKLLHERNYPALSAYTLSSNVGCENNSNANKFFNALYGLGAIGSSKIEDSAETTSNTQKAFNTLMQEAFTTMSNDPRCYALHSFYDMCVSDKRGRLLRAFPCYYILFVDEGRQIGTWKLFDNFYNMSSISNLQVVKSRKIPADTCSFTMSNMFMSYADTYDNTIYNQYVNAYGVKDVIDSIFFPRSYVSKEDQIRQRKQLTDTTPINAGVRIHVRMGYGSDASMLPIVFNGKIAEVNCGETVDIVAQGDGHELNNPLNALGEIDARNLDPAQSWCTLFKDIRGGLARGGLTPRNLLSKLATAKHGGAIKTVIRKATDGRFFYDNPFGLYHFGDKRFKDIFEDSEIVQNMYEVSNKTILNGVNDLISDVNAETCAPIINCNIQDKTMWEIGHLCANAGDDFFFAVRDFGMRSTMCLCMGNHYYAYEYKKDESMDVIAEKRKPFQQFHYYDSYNDIIYNALKASETNMKTNAVGVWEGSDMIWGTGQQSVGPIYLDINIYPEYQKSMTVETGLVSGGDKGIDIPLLTALSEKYNYDEYAGKVNKSVAEKVTTNVLRQSVKDMYEGEICIIGDPSLKPYDRISIIDIIEDVQGIMECETVIHSMNIETGFTTTFIPDVIVRGENNATEVGGQSVLRSFLTAAVTAVVGKGAMAAISGKANVGLFKIASSKAAQTIATKAGQSALTQSIAAGAGAVEGTGMSAVIATVSNPYFLAGVAVAAGSMFITLCNYKEMFFRFCRNIQALSVYPVFKNGRPLIAGMSGHQGSVYGYKYQNANNSIQSYIMRFLDGEQTDSWTINLIGSACNFLLTDENYEICTNKWINNLGLSESVDIIQNGTSVNRNREAFIQNILSTYSGELNSRDLALATLKTKVRIKKFNTSERTSATYMNYQIGGVHDKELWKQEKYKDDETVKKVNQEDLGKNERIKLLYPVEDEPDIKMAVYSDVHPVIKQFKFAHSASPLTFDLIMEGQNTEIRYLALSNGIYDLPMLQEDAVLLIKMIINDETLKDKTVTLASGTQVNSTSSWKSTGFAFSLSCDDMKALEAVSKNLKEDSNWVVDGESMQQNIFDYKVSDSTIQYTVYAEDSIKHTFKTEGDK